MHRTPETSEDNRHLPKGVRQNPSHHATIPNRWSEVDTHFFQNVCAACHGFDGRALDWGDEDNPGFVGTEAQANPWEVLHKIRAGHPGAEMPAMMAFPIQDQVDLLSYTQTLPAK